MNNTEVSVIIPAFNCENTILDTLDSVINQTIKNIEIILINNNSTDKTLDIVKTIHDNRIKIYNCKKQHPSAARNLGIKKSSANIIALLDADDIWFKNKLEKSLDALKKYDFVYHDLYIYKKNKFRFFYKGVARTRDLSNPIKKMYYIRKSRLRIRCIGLYTFCEIKGTHGFSVLIGSLN